MTMILSGSLSWKLFALAHLSSKLYRSLQGLIINQLQQVLLIITRIRIQTHQFWLLQSNTTQPLLYYKSIISMEKGSDITIIYNKFCPFAQRALITALQKEIPANFRKVSLGEKGDFFRENYSRAYGRDPKSDGKVPVLIHGNQILAESQPVCWYIAQTFSSGSNLIPSDTFKRARMRLLISKECSHLIELFNKPKLKLVTSIEKYQQELRQALSTIDKSIEGDYFLGNEITLVDLMIYPWFERWIIIQHYFQVPISQEYKKINNWLICMNRRRSIIETKKLTNNEYYIQRSAKTFDPKL